MRQWTAVRVGKRPMDRQFLRNNERPKLLQFSIVRFGKLLGVDIRAKTTSWAVYDVVILN